MHIRCVCVCCRYVVYICVYDVYVGFRCAYTVCVYAAQVCCFNVHIRCMSSIDMYNNDVGQESAQNL